MANLKIKKKRVYITEYLKEFLEDDISEELYISIIPLSADVKRKIQILQTGTLQGEVGKELFSANKRNIDKLKNASETQRKKIEDEMMESITEKIMTIDMDKRQSIMELTAEAEKMVIINGVDLQDHNLEVDNKKINVDWDFFNQLGDENLLKSVVENVKKYSEQRSLVK